MTEAMKELISTFHPDSHAIQKMAELDLKEGCLFLSKCDILCFSINGDKVERNNDFILKKDSIFLVSSFKLLGTGAYAGVLLDGNLFYIGLFDLAYFSRNVQ
jgi:hypothetical protein